jgi:hypothetical protein
MSFNYSPKIVTNGLVLCLDAANTKSYVSGSTVWNDISQGGNTGTLTNGPTFSSVNGGSIVFDGVDDYVIVNSNILQDSAGTISVWTKVITNADNKFIISSVGSGTNRFYIRQNNSGNFSIVRGANVGITVPAYTLSVWYNITMTWDSTTFYAYSNGTFIGSLGYTGGGNPSPIYIGSQNSSINFYNGNIAQTQIYNRALSSTEIKQNYNATKGRYGL